MINKHILILTNNLVGLYKFRKEIIQNLINNGYKVSISAPSNDYTKKFLEMGCEMSCEDFDRRSKNPFKNFKLLLEYMFLLKRLHPDIVLTYTIKPNIYGGIACRFFKIPYIVNITGIGSAFQKKNIIRRIVVKLYKIALKSANCIFFQNVSNMEFFKNKILSNQHIELLPGSGVNLIEHKFEEYPKNKGKFVFLTIGRILQDKGFNELLDAAKLIHTKHNDIEFCIVGSFDDLSFKDRITELENQGIVVFLGFQDDIHKIIAKSHCIIHPSYHEGMSNVLLEAAATGRPVIASDIPGCRETFIDGVTGISIIPKDIISLTSGIEKMINMSNKEREKMGIKARSYVSKNFDRNIIVTKYTEEIEKILNAEYKIK